jgi:hypothetical protein
MLVEDVNHAVAKAPQQKERGDQREGEKKVFAIRRAEEAAALGAGMGGLDRCNHVLEEFFHAVLGNAGAGQVSIAPDWSDKGSFRSIPVPAFPRDVAGNRCISRLPGNPKLLFNHLVKSGDGIA